MYRRTPMHLIKTISTKSLRSTHIVLGFQALHDSYDVTLKPTTDTPTKSTPHTPKTLRRKKRLSRYRLSPQPPESIASTSFSADAVTMVSMPQSASVEDTHCSDSWQNAKSSAHARSHSQPANIVRLGHPSRPLYTAIRPNMSRPSSSSGPPSPPQTPQKLRPHRPTSLPARAPSPGIMTILSTTTALHEEEEPVFESFAYRPRSMPSHDRTLTRLPAFGSISRHRGGFSVTGETELRMALAREGGGDHEDIFKFKDMEDRSGGKLLVKMRQLKEGLKGLIMRSHDH
ncbi:hypothetical protein H0H87_008154 [Tephrocybe sp. NHM501043]|nr:hypothetical protein H0H87_008154 [Tephrocybe sp. NHM501043]